MFCKECGAKNEEDAKFCSGCGRSLVEGVVAPKKAEVDTKTILYTVKPTFKWSYKILTKGLSTLLSVTLLIFLFLGEAIMEVGEWPVEAANVLYWIVAGVYGVALIYLIIKLLFEKAQYKKLQYNFYADRVEYIDGFLNVAQKELKYKHVRETLFSQNIFERIFGIGTIKLTTNASSGMMYNRYNARGVEGMNGIFIHCVENPKEAYAKVKEIIDAGSEE